MTLHNISTVLFSNILNKNDNEIIMLIFTALTHIFWSIFSIKDIKACQGISLFRQLDALTQVEFIQLACANDKAEVTVLRIVDRAGFVGEKLYFFNGQCHAVALF